MENVGSVPVCQCRVVIGGVPMDECRVSLSLHVVCSGMRLHLQTNLTMAIHPLGHEVDYGNVPV